MFSLSSALGDLHQRLADTFPDTPGFTLFDVPFPLNNAFDPLTWLSAQRVFPQFYWQQRSGDDEAAAFGALRTFTSLAEAQQQLQVYPDDVRVWGLNAFEPSESALFLPRLEWRARGAKRCCVSISIAPPRCVMMRNVLPIFLMRFPLLLHWR